LNEISEPSSWQVDPQNVLAQRCSTLDEGMSANTSLTDEICWCVRAWGDWVAAVITPAFIRVFLLPGGGELWGDIPPGHPRYVTLGRSDWKFFAGNDEVLGRYQYVDLAQPISEVMGMDVAYLLVNSARSAMGLEAEPEVVTEVVTEEPPKPLSRRGFLRALSGRR
jgi:hypothetical protein